MGLKSWMREYYPIEACASMSDLAAVEQAIQKWKGLKKKNLKKHGVEVTHQPDGYIPGDYSMFVSKKTPMLEEAVDRLYIDGTSCSLCLKHHRLNSKPWIKVQCVECPLFQHLGYNCDDVIGPYTAFEKQDKVKPMIRALKEVREFLIKEEEAFNELAETSKDTSQQVNVSATGSVVDVSVSGENNQVSIEA